MINPNEEYRDNDVENEDANRSEPAQVPQALFMTEMLESGDLSQLIGAVRQHRERVPNAILWRLCLCCKFHVLQFRLPKSPAR